jgi:hypothetical protein
MSATNYSMLAITSPVYTAHTSKPSAPQGTTYSHETHLISRPEAAQKAIEEVLRSIGV